MSAAPPWDLLAQRRLRARPQGGQRAGGWGLTGPPPAQLYAKLQAVKAEIQDQHDEYIRVRQDLEEAQNEQTRELKLK